MINKFLFKEKRIPKQTFTSYNSLKWIYLCNYEFLVQGNDRNKLLYIDTRVVYSCNSFDKQMFNNYNNLVILSLLQLITISSKTESRIIESNESLYSIIHGLYGRNIDWKENDIELEIGAKVSRFSFWYWNNWSVYYIEK